jgi:hypothetical protein
MEERSTSRLRAVVRIVTICKGQSRAATSREWVSIETTHRHESDVVDMRFRQIPSLQAGHARGNDLIRPSLVTF